MRGEPHGRDCRSGHRNFDGPGSAAVGIGGGSPRSEPRRPPRALHPRVVRPELRARHMALAATTGDPTTLSALDAAAEAMVNRGAPAVAAELIELALKL